MLIGSNWSSSGHSVNPLSTSTAADPKVVTVNTQVGVNSSFSEPKNTGELSPFFEVSARFYSLLHYFL